MRADQKYSSLLLPLPHPLVPPIRAGQFGIFHRGRLGCWAGFEGSFPFLEQLGGGHVEEAAEGGEEHGPLIRGELAQPSWVFNRRRDPSAAVLESEDERNVTARS